jgi:cysteine desulfurase
MNEKREIYFDYAAATPLDPRVLAAIAPYLDGCFGNPSSLHSAGRLAKTAIDDSRDAIAKVLSCRASEIVFTSGGTEADNLAVLGAARKNKSRCDHLITSTIEHHAVLKPIEHLVKNEGFSADYVKVDREGVIDPADVISKLTNKTALVSIMYANNEIGTIQPIAEIGKAIAEWKKQNGRKADEPPYFHTDACQAAGALPLEVKKLGVDLLTLNGSKICGPKGAGVLFIANGVKIEPIVFGGGQEWRLRSGTENVPAIVGLAAALKIAATEKERENARLTLLRDKLIAGLLKIPKTFLNGHASKRLPNNVNVTILDIEGEAMVLYLDEEGFCVSTGSACTSANLEPSHVIRALGLPYEAAHGSLRVTLGRFTKEEEIDAFLVALPPIVAKLRKLSPVRLEMKNFK